MEGTNLLPFKTRPCALLDPTKYHLLDLGTFSDLRKGTKLNRDILIGTIVELFRVGQLVRGPETRGHFYYVERVVKDDPLPRMTLDNAYALFRFCARTFFIDADRIHPQPEGIQ